MLEASTGHSGRVRAEWEWIIELLLGYVMQVRRALWQVPLKPPGA
jgi:hypothetical protein